MANINYNINSPEEEYESNNNMSIKSSPIISNSIISGESNYRNNETINENEDYNNGHNQNYLFNFEGKKPRTIIDYLNINSDEYKKQKMYQKIKAMLNNLTSLSRIYVDEICYITWLYSQKLPKKKLSTIVPIIVYKIILKYNIESVSLKDLKDKINFKYKTYFKNEKLFTELNECINKNKKINRDSFNYINKYNFKNQNYSELVYNSVTNHIKKIKEKSQTHSNIIKIKGKTKPKKNYKEKINIENKDKNNEIIENIIGKLKMEDNNIDELYCSPLNFELNNCQEQCKFLIFNYNRNSSNPILDKSFTDKIINLNEEEETNLSSENKFNDYFKNKIGCDILGLGMIKYFIDKNNIIILSYKILKEIFNYNTCQIKKSIFYIELYIKYINNN